MPAPSRRLATLSLLSLTLVLLSRADSDDREYEYDPFDDEDNNAKPDEEGSVVPPENIWHACRFGPKNGDVFDLRALSKNEKLLRAHYRWGSEIDVTTSDWVHQDVTQYNVTYFLNVCADVIELPQACKVLRKLTPAPAFQVTADGRCHALGTLKTFKWKPLDTKKPGKGMVLTYKNGDLCGNRGQRKSVRYTFTCARAFNKDQGPMVIYEHDRCRYDVLWPSEFGCPGAKPPPVAGVDYKEEQTSVLSSGAFKWSMVAALVLLGAGCGYYYFSRKALVGSYSSL